MCVLVAFILLIVAGTSYKADSNSNSNSNNNQNSGYGSMFGDGHDQDGYTIFDYNGIEGLDVSVDSDLAGTINAADDILNDNPIFNLPIIGSAIRNKAQSFVPFAGAVFAFGIGIVALVFAVMSFVLSIFVFRVIEVGGYRFFIDNSTTKASPGLLLSAFQSGYYLNTVKILFFEGLYLILWTLLLIIPGIIKSYEYRMIPYILAENPELDKAEVFARSKQMMNGNKFASFLLDLSFIGWGILSMLTFGLVGIFWMNPYKQATNAELYLDLKKTHFGGDEVDVMDGYYY